MFKELEKQSELQLIVFQLASESYAVPITNVQEIIMLQKPTKLPNTPAFSEGMINLRGKVISVIDGKKKFNIAETIITSESRIIILDVENEIIGLIVDSVSEVIHLNTKDIEPIPLDISIESESLCGVGKYNNQLLILIDPLKLLNHSQVEELERTIPLNSNIKENNELILK